MNGKSSFLVALIIGLFLAALFFREGKLILLLLPFLSFLMIGLLKFPSEIELRAERRHQKSSAAAQESIEMCVLVENVGRTQAYLSLYDPLFETMELLEGQIQQTVLLSPGEQAELKYAFRAGRGIYSWNSIRDVATDPIALFELRQNCPAPAEIMVRPDPTRLRHIPLRPRFTRHIPGSIPARLAGSSTTFFGVREYHLGDPLRRINWRMTARHPRKLFTKEFEQEEIANIGLVLDSRSLDQDDAGGDSLFEHSVRATASLAELFLREGNRVGLLVFGEKMTPLFPSSGKKQLNRINKCLARASARKNISLEYLSYFSSRLFPSRSLVVMISPLGHHDLPAYQRLSAAGYQVILISPNPVEYTARKMPENQIGCLAFRAARLERYVQLNQLLSIGVRVIDWPVDQPLDEAIRKAMTPLNGHERWSQR